MFKVSIVTFALWLQFAIAALAQSSAPEFDVRRVQIGIQMTGLTEPYFLVDRDSSGSTIARKLIGDQDKYSFSKFRIFKSENEKLDSAVLSLLKKGETGRQGSSWHGPVLIVVIRLKHSVRRFEYDGMPIEYFSKPWSDLIRDRPANNEDLNEHLGLELRSVVELLLNLDISKSQPWTGDKCQVHIPVIRRGANEASNWDFPLQFSENIDPKSFSFEMDWNDRLSKSPDGIVDLGTHYGYYQVTPVIVHPK